MSKKEQATKLRLEGKSYGQIMKALDIPSKGTLSYWFHDLELTPAARNRLKHNTELAYNRGLFAFNRKRTKKIQAENRKLRIAAQDEIKSLSIRDIRLIGAALYWAEGTKRFGPKNSPRVSFSNADPRMVRVFLRYVREVLQIPDKRLKPGIGLHPGLDADQARDFWAQVTSLPRTDFWISVSTSSASKRKRHLHRLPHGTLQLRINRRQEYYTVLGHIEGIAEQP